MKINPRTIAANFSKLFNSSIAVESKNKGYVGNDIPYGYNQDDYNPEWHDKNKFPHIKKMCNDPMVAACIDAIRLPIEHTNVMIEPASDDSIDVKIAEAVQNELKNNALWDWSQFQRHALEMISWGNGTFAVKPYRMDGSDLNHLNLMPRLPETLERWFYDEMSKLIRIEQHVTLPTGQDALYKINAQDLVVFTNNMRGMNLEGESMLRACWLQWYNKDFVIKQAMRAVQIGSVPAPAITLPPTPGPEDKASAEKAAANWVASNKNYIILPDGSKISFVGDMGAIDKLIAFIEHANNEIAARFQAGFINLGTTSTGSYALSESKTDFFKLSLKHYQGIIESVTNKKIIRRFVTMNWGPQYECPKLKYGKLNAVSAEELSVILERLARSNFLRPTEEIQEQLLEELNLPTEQTFLPVSQGLPTQVESEKEPETEEPEDDEDDPEDVENQDGSEMCSCGHEHEFAEVDTNLKFRRELTEQEKELADIPSYRDQLNEYKTIFEGIARERKSVMIDKLTKKGKAILNKGLSIDDFWAEVNEYASDAPNKLGLKTFAAKMVPTGKKALKYGKATVKTEFSKQGGISMAETPDGLSDAENDTVKMMAYTAALTILDQLVQVWKDQLSSQRTIGNNSGTDLAKALKKTSMVQFSKKVGTMASKLFGNGRGRETQKLADSGDIEYLIRSEIMDPKICSECVMIDKKQIFPNDPLWGDVINGPYAYCLGDDRCRGINMFIRK